MSAREYARAERVATVHGKRGEGGLSVAACEVCGNEYERSMQITIGGATHTFDSFECAIHALAPVCEHCGCRVVGHGIEAPASVYCCAYCARQSGVSGARDHV
jgi:hypothetical protein